MRHAVVVAIIIVAVIGSIGIGTTATSVVAAEDVDIVAECAAEPPEDFADPPDGNETIGWFAGYWYDEPLDINATDGITEEELENLSARTAARLEAMRCLPFERMPAVEIITRDEFANETAEQFADVDPQRAAFDNAQFETLLLVGSEEDSIAVREEARTVSVGGFYNFVDERIVVISDDPESLRIDEEILAHELGHALQDQHFNLSRYDRDTMDLDKGKLGVIEGDVHRVEMAYLERCEEERWSEPCVTQDPETTNPGPPPSWGLWFMQFQPYSDGPAFVEHIFQQGEWDAVDAIYEDMPTSAMHTIDPELYGEVDPAELAVPDRSTGEWERITWENETDYNVIGRAGMAGMFIDPTYDDGFANTGPIVTGDDFLNLDESGQLDDFDPIDYDLAMTEGWRGDRLYVYTNGDHTGTVWKTAWTDQAAKASFLEAYETLAEYRGGERVDGYAHTWTFGSDSEFDMALTLYPDGDRLWILTAPTVDDLTDVHGDIELIEEEPVDDAPPADESPRGDTQIHDDRFIPVHPPDDVPDEIIPNNDDPLPGLGTIIALAGLVVAVLVYRHWHRSS